MYNLFKKERFIIDSIDLINKIGFIDNLSTDDIEFMTEYYLENVLSKKSENSIALYLDSSILRSLIFFICLAVSEKNIRCSTQLRIDQIQENQIFKCIENQCSFKGEYFKCIKISDDKVDLQALNTKSLKALSHNIWPIELAMKRLVLTEVDQTKILRNGNEEIKARSFRENMASLLNLKIKNQLNVETTIIVTKKKNYEGLKSTLFSVDGNDYYLGSLCSIGEFLSDGTVDEWSHSSKIEFPQVIFSSNENKLLRLVRNLKRKSKEVKVVFIGDEWLMETKVTNIHSLRLDWEEMGVSCSVITSVNKFITTLPKVCLDENINNTIPLTKINKLRDINVVIGETDPDVSNSYFKLYELIREINHQQDLIYIQAQLKRFIKLAISKISDSEEILRDLVSNIEHYAQNRFDLSDYQDDFQNMIDNSCSSFLGERLKNKILYNKKIVVITEKLLVPSARLVYPNNYVFSYEEIQSFKQLEQFEEIVLINPKTTYLNFWINSNISKKLYLLFPEIIVPLIYKRIKRNINNIKEMDKYFTDDHSFLVQCLRINKDLENQLSKYVKKIDDENIKKMEDLELDDEPINNNEYLDDTKIESEIGNYSSINADPSSEVVWKLHLQSGKYVFGTRYGKFGIVDENGIYHLTNYEHINAGDTVLELRLPYSDDEYQIMLDEYIKTRQKKDDHTLLETDPQNRDFYWKYCLLDYIQKWNLNKGELQSKFETIGFKQNESYFSRWVSGKKIPIVPRDKQLVKYIGKLIGNQDLETNYEKFYWSSKVIKEKMSTSRGEILKESDGEGIVDLKKIGKVIKDKVINISKFEGLIVKNNKINTILGENNDCSEC